MQETASEQQLQHFDLLNLSNRKGIASRDVFTFRMNNSLEKSHVT